MTVTEYRQTAVTTWVIAAICVGLAVSGPDVASVLSAIVACAACGAATYQWLMAEGTGR
jgi:hypothetical protein